MGKIIAVGSGKGGTGKTTTAAAISSCLAALGFRTLCIDFDAELRTLDLALCMADYAVADFTDVLDGRMELLEACRESPRIPNLFFIAAPTARGWEETDTPAIRQKYEEIRREFDYCLIDAPAGIGLGYTLSHTDADMAIIVTVGELPAMRDAQRIAEAARDLGVSELRLIVNRVNPKTYKRMQTTVDDVIDAVGARLIGIVKEDKYIPQALHENTPLVLFRKRFAAYDFLDAALRITGRDIPMQL